MSRELFVYWRTPAPGLDEALAAARRWQDVLAAQHPRLQARLLRRSDVEGPWATVMEVYAAPGGLDKATIRHIVDGGNERLAAWCPQGRQVEPFEPA